MRAPFKAASLTGTRAGKILEGSNRKGNKKLEGPRGREARLSSQLCHRCCVTSDVCLPSQPLFLRAQERLEHCAPRLLYLLRFLVFRQPPQTRSGALPGRQPQSL